MTVRTQTAEVIAVRALRPDVREIALRPLDHDVSFRAGQWVTIHLDLGKDKPVVRAYSLAEPPCEPNRLVLCFDRVKGGEASNVLFGLQAGDAIAVSDPLGNFVLPELHGRAVAMIAWFTGVAPLRSMILQMARCWEGEPPRTQLVYGAPSAEVMPYHEELQALAERHPWFVYTPMIAPAGASAEEALAAMLARLPAALREGLGPQMEPQRAHPMIAGVKALVLPAREILMREFGYALEQVQKETYD